MLRRFLPILLTSYLLIMGTDPASSSQATKAETTSPLPTTSSPPAKSKTIYLIRHAESEENHRLACLTRSFTNIGRFRLPSKDDITTSMQLLDMRGQVDSDVSSTGKKQIEDLATQLEKDDFLTRNRIKLVAHSPLKRARETSKGMLGCVTQPDTLKPECVERVVELPSLMERTPSEYLPYNYDKFSQRISDFEGWLGRQEEEHVAIVGHSQFFRSMLGLDYKFGNCDVWQITFTPGKDVAEDAELPRGWSGLKNMYKHDL